MTYAVTHFLVPAFLIALFRDFYLNKKSKRKFTLHYVLIAGIGGLIPDLDYILYYMIKGIGIPISQHRVFFHNFLFVFILFFLGIIFIKTKTRELSKHKLKISTVFFVLAFASFTHLLLDWIVIGWVWWLIPFSSQQFGINLISKIPEMFQKSFVEIVDAVLLAIWMIYLEVKHKISDFI